MRRPDEVLHYGLGGVAALAARCRTSRNYSSATFLEHWFGERRTWDEQGKTMFATFSAPWLMDQDRRCESRELSEAHT